MVAKNRSNNRLSFFNSGKHQRKLLMILVAVLTLVGLFFVFEASSAESYLAYGYEFFFVKQQAYKIALGLLLASMVSVIPLKMWKVIAPIGFVLSLLLLIGVLIPGIGLELNGAKRWINFGPLLFQPVEVFKFFLVLYFASWLSKTQKLSSFLFFTFISGLLLLLQPDFGSLLIVLFISFGMFYLSGGKTSSLLGVSLAGLVLLAIFVVTSPYRLQRVSTFLNPQSDPLGSSFHIRQITLALGNGGWFGQGIGNSQQKYAYIPEASSDSIFAIVAEEVGFVGSVLIIIIFAFLWAVSYLISVSGTDQFAKLVGLGFLLWVGGQTVLNLSAVVALIPLTGLPLPFFSFGGSAMVMILVVIGVWLRISKESLK